MAYNDMDAHERDELDRTLTEQSYTRETDDLIQSLAEGVAVVAVVLILLHFGLGWLDGHFGWHTNAFVFGWLKAVGLWFVHLVQSLAGVFQSGGK